MTYATKSKISAREILCALRESACPQDDGGTGGISAPSILLAALLELEGKMGPVENRDPQGVIKGPQGPLRKVRGETAAEAIACSPQERESVRQRIEQLRDAVHELSHEGALESQALAIAVNGFPLSPRLPGRVAMLRGFGNAICPPLAAQFIQAAEEAMSHE